MSLQSTVDERFVLDFADRLAHAQRRSGLSASEIADRIEVHRNTVASWLNGRNRPRFRDLRAFAMTTGYPVDWLMTGHVPFDGPDGEPPEGIEPSTYSLQGYDSLENILVPPLAA